LFARSLFMSVHVFACHNKEAFIKNFSAPYSLLQRHLVGEEGSKGGEKEAKRPDEHQNSPPRLLITELTTSSFLPSIMDLEKVENAVALTLPAAYTLSTSILYLLVHFCPGWYRHTTFIYSPNLKGLIRHTVKISQEPSVHF